MTTHPERDGSLHDCWALMDSIALHVSRGTTHERLNLYPHLELEGGGTTQQEFVDWGEVVEDCGIRHPGNMEKKASREDAKTRRREDAKTRGARRARRARRKRAFPSLSSSHPAVSPFSGAHTSLSCLPQRLSASARDFYCMDTAQTLWRSGAFRVWLGGHNRDAVGSRFGIRPRVGLGPRPTLGWGSQRRWRWQAKNPTA